MAPPRAFVSYSHDSPEHKAWVHDLAWVLRAEYGIDVILDAWDVGLGGDLPRFMEKIASSDKVLMICTEAYANKCDEASGGGVAYEKMLVTPKIVADVAAETIIPVIRNNPETKRPVFVQGKRFIDFREDARYDYCVRELAAAIHGVGTKPPIGRNPFREGLDASFGNKGRLLLEESRLTPLRIRCSNQCIEVIGQLDNDIVITRLQDDGELDITFSDSGVMRIDSAKLGVQVGDVVPCTDSLIVVPRHDLEGGPRAARKISVAGVVEDYFPDLRFDAVVGSAASAIFKYSRAELSLMCIREDGTPEEIGNAGYVKLLIPEGFPLVFLRAKILAQRIYLFGITRFPQDERALIFRFLADGALDTDFGEGGVVDVSKLIWFLGIQDIAQMPDGRLIVGGYGNEANLVCLSESGKTDTSFGLNGVVEFRASARSTCQRVAWTDNSIVVAGESSDGRSRNEIFVAKLTPVGRPIEAFHGDGFLSFSIRNNDSIADVCVAEHKATLLCHSDRDAPKHFRSGLARVHL